MNRVILFLGAAAALTAAFSSSGRAGIGPVEAPCARPDRTVAVDTIRPIAAHAVLAGVATCSAD